MSDTSLSQILIDNLGAGWHSVGKLLIAVEVSTDPHVQIWALKAPTMPGDRMPPNESNGVLVYTPSGRLNTGHWRYVWLYKGAWQQDAKDFADGLLQAAKDKADAEKATAAAVAEQKRKDTKKILKDY